MKKIKFLILTITFCLFITTFNSTFASTNNNIPQKTTKNSEVYFGPYMRELQRRIKINWEPPKEHVNGQEKTTILFKIAKNGYLLGLRIFKSSGNSSFDDSCKSAIFKTAPFKPLPAEYNGKSIDIQFTFGKHISKNNT